MNTLSDLRKYIKEEIQIHEFRFPNGIIKPEPCIYFLCANEEIVYIGQAHNLFIRLGQHIESKIFNRAFYVKCSCDNLSNWEKDLQEIFLPIYNSEPWVIKRRKEIEIERIQIELKECNCCGRLLRDCICDNL